MKLRKKIMIAALAVIGVAVLYCGVVFALMSREMAKLRPIETGEIAPGIFALRDDFIDIYLVRSGDEYLAIDAGNSEKGVIAGLAELGIPREKVTTVLLTHTDYDHVRGIGAFPNAQVYIPEGETVMIDGSRYKKLFIKNSLSVPYKTLVGGETVSLGPWTVRTIPVPGHTLGSACYLVDGRLLFTGDSIAIESGLATTFNDFYNMDTETQARALPALTKLGEVEWVLTAHYGASNDYRGIFARIAVD